MNDKLILVGDLNVAPLEHDVWSSKQLSNVISHTAIERNKVLNNIKEFNWVDVPRNFVIHSEKLYSWWSYRNRCWKTSNRGRRLDHVWVSNNISYRVKSCTIFSQVRGWPEPSDHVPIMVEIF